MSKWFYFNLFLFLLALWNVFNHFSFPMLQIHIIIGLIGLILILFNWSRHAVFSTIRDAKDRHLKIRLAQLAKKDMPFHRWIGTGALLIILLHASIIVQQFGFNWENMKMVSGLIAAIILAGVVITGWMRRIKPTGRKRMAHLRLGIGLFLLIVLHLIL